VLRNFQQRLLKILSSQYGGSVKPDNSGELLSQKDIDGAHWLAELVSKQILF